MIDLHLKIKSFLDTIFTLFLVENQNQKVESREWKNKHPIGKLRPFGKLRIKGEWGSNANHSAEYTKQ